MTQDQADRGQERGDFLAIGAFAAAVVIQRAYRATLIPAPLLRARIRGQWDGSREQKELATPEAQS
jgi:hypothetical protein